jgi:hypothetical protein
MCQHREWRCCVGNGDGCHLTISLITINNNMRLEILGTSDALGTCRVRNAKDSCVNRSRQDVDPQG